MDRTSHRDLFLKTSKALFILILIPSLVLLFLGPLLFGFVFGDVWEVSGHYAQIFMLFYVLRFIFSPQSTLLISSGRLKTELIFNISFFIFQILSVIIGYEIGDYIYSFIFMSFTGFIHFLILGRILFKSSIQLDNEKSN
jgi:O-antigen/teichoic acid export membrane protein